MKESEKDMVVSFYNQLLSKHVHHTDKCFCRFPKLTLESLFILLDVILMGEQKREFFMKLFAARYPSLSDQERLFGCLMRRNDHKEITPEEFEIEIKNENGLFNFSYCFYNNYFACVKSKKMEEVIRSM